MVLGVCALRLDLQKPKTQGLIRHPNEVIGNLCMPAGVTRSSVSCFHFPCVRRLHWYSLYQTVAFLPHRGKCLVINRFLVLTAMMHEVYRLSSLPLLPPPPLAASHHHLFPHFLFLTMQGAMAHPIIKLWYSPQVLCKGLNVPSAPVRYPHTLCQGQLLPKPQLHPHMIMETPQEPFHGQTSPIQAHRSTPGPAGFISI